MIQQFMFSDAPPKQSKLAAVCDANFKLITVKQLSTDSSAVQLVVPTHTVTRVATLKPTHTQAATRNQANPNPSKLTTQSNQQRKAFMLLIEVRHTSKRCNYRANLKHHPLPQLTCLAKHVAINIP